MAYSELAVSALGSPSDSSGFTATNLADPVLSANVYANGRLDDLLLRCIADFWSGVRERHTDVDSFLWFVRYRRGGEHLKLRIHGPAALSSIYAEQLAAACQRYFASLPPDEEAESAEPSRRGNYEIPPIDPEDQVTSDYPDRSLITTTYERSYVSLGGSPLLNDDLYVSRLTRFLGLSAERILAELKLDQQGQVPHKQRQTRLLKTVIGALAGLDWNATRRLDYLKYHRDWLLRFSLLKALDRTQRSQELLERFATQTEAMSSSKGPIERTLQKFWDRREEVDADPLGSPLRALADYLERFRGIRDYDLDPFTNEPGFPGIFKALHGAANQLGLNMIDEAFTYHLLLQIRMPSLAAEQVHLTPP